MASKAVVYIPEGFTGRLDGEGDRGKSFYAGGVNFCNVFIFSSSYRLSFSHCDPSVQLEYLENEVRWIMQGEVAEIKAWRVSHGDIDPPEYANVWKALKEKLDADSSSTKVKLSFHDVVMYESVSVGPADNEPRLHKIAPADLCFPGSAQPEVLRAVLRLNAFCTVNGDKFSPMKLLYQSDWIDLDKITEVNENAIKMVTVDPWVKECGADKNEALDGVKDVFAYINVYRQYKNLPPMKQSKVGVNEQCPCKSGKKYKKCHFEYQQKYLQY